MFYRRFTSITLPVILVIMSMLALISGCSEPGPEPEIIEFTDDELADEIRRIQDSVSITLHEGFGISLWATDDMLGDPVGIDIDNYGRAMVAVTNRRSSSMFDIRRNTDWLSMIESLSWETVEERRNFLRSHFSPGRSDENSWLPDRNGDGSHDWRDLTVEKEEIYRIEDLTGNGHANRSQVFIRDFHNEDSDIAGTVLFHDDEVFVGVAPDLWRIRDTNGDGRGDWKESISHGYGVHISFGGHGMSGLRTGPDGRIYWSVGDIGLSTSDQDGKRWHYPHQGIVVRSEPDGSNFEVYAAGLRNTHEFDFDKYGNLISVDNDGDHPGEYERVVYLINGSDTGWRINWQFGKYDQPDNNEYKVWMDEEYYKPRFDSQAAHILPPIAPYHSGPSGLVYNPGTALDSEWEDHFFVSSFTGTPVRSAIDAFSLKPSGASFELERDVDIMDGLLATSLSFGPEGALYMSDWVEGWQPTDTGRIWKMDTPDHAGSAIRLETRRLLGEDFGSRQSSGLVGLMEHEDMRVRRKAQFELAGRRAADDLLSAITGSDHQLARIHGIWGLAQMARSDPDAAAPLTGFLDDEDPEIRAQSAKMLGDVRYSPAAGELIRLLEDGNARVRFFATEALGRIGYAPAIEPIVDMLEDNDDEDVYLRHAGAIALERIGDADAVTGLAGHPSRAVRIAAVVALKRLEDPGAARFLEDEDEYVVTNAARAISDDAYVEEALPALARMLGQDRFVNEPLMRRAINASLYGGTRADADRLAAFALRQDVGEVLKAEALYALSTWTDTSPLDRVTGRYWGGFQHEESFAKEAIAEVYEHVLEGNSSEVKVAALKTLGSLKVHESAPEIMALLNGDPDAGVRTSALNALLDMEYEGIFEAMTIALQDEVQSVRMNALQIAADIELPVEDTVHLLESVLETGMVEERQTALKILGEIDGPDAHAVLKDQFELLLNGELDDEIKLDLVMAVETGTSEELNGMLSRYQSEKDDNPVSRFDDALYGGNADEGRRIFYRGTAAECVRCHAVAGQGGEVGPDLTSIGKTRSREMLLESLVDPGATLSPGYGVVTLTLENGETIRGLLEEETDQEVTVLSGNQRSVVHKEDIAERRNSPSAMPNMGEILSKNQIRDLVEYMTTLDGSE